ncbi:hypothetical protein OIU77_030732 [Salix suchowensis]|uniref:ADP-ribosylation factor 1 n=1 Tax=Salix suchowensis TaxID=1278906 RepID=A0ABQ9BCZ3_9ROSI|nr:hypothetical protein OIU77_030732 [Salix suchowensis]
MFSSVFGNKEARILVLGLDNAGKTTILYRLQMGEVVSTIPTIGFNVETVQYNNIKFQDPHYLNALYTMENQFEGNFLVGMEKVGRQASDHTGDAIFPTHKPLFMLSIQCSCVHACFLYNEEELRGAIVLVFANKQDLPGALDDATVTEALELHKIKNRQWTIFKTSAIKGEGLFEGLDWLSNTLKSGVMPFDLH